MFVQVEELLYSFQASCFFSLVLSQMVLSGDKEQEHVHGHGLKVYIGGRRAHLKGVLELGERGHWPVKCWNVQLVDGLGVCSREASWVQFVGRKPFDVIEH